MSHHLKCLIVSVCLWMATTTHAEIYYIHNDHLGNPQAVTDENRNIVWRGEYSPFGELVNEAGTLKQPHRFPGQHADPETGLYYNYFRDYDPSLGRYVQSDPIGLDGGINTYGYVYQNPVRYTDPEGLAVPAVFAWCAANPACAAAAAQAARKTAQMCVEAAGIALSGWWGANAKPPENAYDPNGPKAPGKPGPEDGFEDPKGGDNWAPNPNPGKGGGSHGWKDAKGNVWVPSGQGGRAHGGPHWDVQTPGGGYVNVRPRR